MADIPVMKFGGTSMQGKHRFGPDEDRLLEDLRRMDEVNEIYRTLAQRRNSARARRLAQVARDFILPLHREGVVPVIVVSAFDWATDKLDQLAAAITSEPSRREYARLLMSGELRANSALAMTLEEKGCPARSLTGREAGIVTRGGAVGAQIDHVENTHVAELIDNPAYLTGAGPLIVVDRDGSLAMMVAGILSQKTERPIKALFGGLEAYWNEADVGAAAQPVDAAAAPAVVPRSPSAASAPTPPSPKPRKKKSAGC